MPRWAEMATLCRQAESSTLPAVGTTTDARLYVFIELISLSKTNTGKPTGEALVHQTSKWRALPLREWERPIVGNVPKYHVRGGLPMYRGKCLKQIASRAPAQVGDTIEEV
jgi:hypothetical protein